MFAEMHISLKYNTLMRALLLPALICTLLQGTLRAQTPSPEAAEAGTSGTDFWVTWFVNAYNRATGTVNNSQLALFVVGEQSATVTVTNPRTTYARTVSHTGGTKTVIQLPSNSRIRSGQADTMGYHVTSTAPILLYASNYWKDSWDVCNVLPTSALGTEYLIQDPSNVNSPFASVMALVATEDSTRISMILSCPVAGLPTLGLGDSLTMVLDRGQSLMLRSTNTGTFMLSERAVTASKPIALFQGHSCGLVGATGGRDLMVEQARPLNLWGQEFLVTPTYGRNESEEVWITAGADNCQIYVDGAPYATPLSRGAAACYSPNQRAVRHITTSQPAYVALYLYSYDHGRSLGDPAQVAVNPVDRWVSHSIIPLHNCNTNPSDEQYITDNHHYINIVTRTADAGGMRLNGQPVSGFTDLGNGYSHTVLTPGPGAHTLSNSQGTFEARGYGLGKWVCYAFEGGIAIERHVAGRDTTEIYDTTCLGTLYEGHGFRFDASQCSPGTFHLWDSTVVADTVHCRVLHLLVLPTAETRLRHILVAGDTLRFGDTLITLAGEYRFRHTAANGCDSVVVLEVCYEQVSFRASADGICPGDSVVLEATGLLAFRWASSPHDPSLDSQQGHNPIVVYPRTTTVYDLLDGDGNRIASHSVSVEPPPALCIEGVSPYIDFDHPVIIMHDCSEGRHRTSWDFDDGAHFTGERMRRIVPYPLPDSIRVTMTSCNRYGCCADTTITIPTCTLSVWFPNVFTPDAEINNHFGCVTTHEVAEFEMDIYNRWGLIVWSTKNINQPWDGTHNGTPVKQEAYVYRWRLRDTSNRVLSGVGTVTLLR